MSFIGNKPANFFENPKKQVSTSNSGTTISLDYPVTNVADIRLTINAVVQSYDNYSVSGSTLTVGGTLNNDRVEILFVGRTYGSISPSDGSINTNAIVDSAVTNVKLGSDINATKLTAGLVPTARLGSGTASSSTILYGDQTFKTAPSGGLVKLAQAKGTSAVTNIVHDSIFSTTYDFYKIIGYTNASAINGDLRFRFRSGGSEINGSYYRGGGQGWQQGASSSLTNTTFLPRYNESKFDLLDSINSNNNFGEFFEMTLGGMLDRDEGLCATLRMEVNQMISNGHYRQYHYGGFYANQGANEDYDGFMLFYSNANVQYYSYAVYGMLK